MERSLYLASLGGFHVGANPLVGAVIVHDERIIGEGYHKKYGGPHAEVNALRSIYESDKNLLPNSEIYITLEPCNHHGKTPPCTEAIIKSGIRKVTLASIDPNPKMSGKSIKMLEENGVQVRHGLLTNEEKALNRKFIKNQKTRLPYVVLKWAQSSDGYMGKRGKQVWISNEMSKYVVHRWREEFDGILIGTETAIIDNPKLTNRRGFGRQPMRIVLDRKGRIPTTHHILSDEHQTTIFTCIDEYPSDKNKIVLEENDFTLQRILEEIFNLGVTSLMVEGGKLILQEFIKERCWDEARILYSRKSLSSGIRAPYIKGQKVQKTPLLGDNLLIVNRLNN